jgi:hypothetical protein
VNCCCDDATVRLRQDLVRRRGDDHLDGRAPKPSHRSHQQLAHRASHAWVTCIE